MSLQPAGRTADGRGGPARDLDLQFGRRSPAGVLDVTRVSGGTSERSHGPSRRGHPRSTRRGPYSLSVPGFWRATKVPNYITVPVAVLGVASPIVFYFLPSNAPGPGPEPPPTVSISTYDGSGPTPVE